ncbi:hypothetical protein A3L14_00120 [Thermococcus thioreducens]|uniref:Uncharacterized protein n=1 Tax=Thermococcus thioreducens TaxID=277988 RepID=A0A0Q2QTR6_9EURY|nr:hypothetical protein A3L14_00120 [Thermococcus thioreducens]KQH83405.1 hypothetical protein AMR53_00120 [Thermococcus thioreducens]
MMPTLKNYHPCPHTSTDGLIFPVETKVFFDAHLKDPPEFHFHWNPVLEMDGFKRTVYRKGNL